MVVVVVVVMRVSCSTLWTDCNQGLKYNFEGGGTVQLSGPPVRSRPPFISGAHAVIAGSKIINDRLNVLSMILCCFFLFCNILWKHLKLWIYDRKNVKFEWLINHQQRLLTCRAQQQRFRLWNPIILPLKLSRLKFTVPRIAFRCVSAYFNPWLQSTVKLTTGII